MTRPKSNLASPHASWSLSPLPLVMCASTCSELLRSTILQQLSLAKSHCSAASFQPPCQLHPLTLPCQKDPMLESNNTSSTSSTCIFLMGLSTLPAYNGPSKTPLSQPGTFPKNPLTHQDILVHGPCLCWIELNIQLYRNILKRSYSGRPNQVKMTTNF